ncbi:response regulator [Flaviaesturariibacter flavus]|uniref:Response regulator n=1 Tax=Flaviaesturariibacter flavus TaxID=2502780 RepID=A0A4R1BBR9_9BACT|nr:response regulator [Flaviaesturariibacter flavus]TCJ14450.1 response regulator [Flaviaesturariibacter flavus]
MPYKQALRILLVDDDATDRELFSEALQLVAPQHQLIEAGNGQEALALLEGGAALPDLVLLDLNMPVKDGREALLDIRRNPALRCLPVCILSTSSAHFDVERAYADGASLFLVKPLEYAQLKGLIETLSTLFTRFAVLP